jgi:hypothetical protein
MTEKFTLAPKRNEMDYSPGQQLPVGQMPQAEGAGPDSVWFQAGQLGYRIKELSDHCSHTAKTFEEDLRETSKTLEHNLMKLRAMLGNGPRR